MLDIADMPTRLTPVVSLHAQRLPRLALTKPRVTRKLPRNDYATEVIPHVQKSLSGLSRTGDIITQEVQAFVRMREATPVAVQLSALRLLSISSKQWHAYPVLVDGYELHIRLFPANIRTDECIVSSVMPMLECPADQVVGTGQQGIVCEWWEKGGER